MVPHLGFDSTIAFFTEGYLFGHRRFEQLGTDAFTTRLLGRPITILRGVPAARFFYEGDRFTRTGALPISVVHSLQDEGSVQTLDDGAHRARKELFTKILDADGNAALVQEFMNAWNAHLPRWQGQQQEFLPALNRVLADAVLAWVDLPQPPVISAEIARQSAAMIAGAGTIGPRNWWGRLRRRSTEEWALEAVRESRARRAGRLQPLLAAVSDDEVAAIELLNLVRPVVAVGRFIAFAALALHDSPPWGAELRRRPERAREFAQEVRRLAPFFPVIAGRARAAETWNDVQIAPGGWVMVDLFATNHHPRQWREPWVFNPNRYSREPEEAIVAQGAGPIATTHRCPGEPVTVNLLAVASTLLASAEWELPPQDLHTRFTHFPADPGQGVQIRFRP